MKLDLRAYDEAVEHYNAEQRILDEVLRELCRRHPRHDSLGAVLAKGLLIGRGFASGIERKVDKGSRDSGLSHVIHRLVSCSGRLDSIFEPARALREPTTRASIPPS